MIIRTRIFQLYNGEYRSLSDLARAMEISVSQIYRVREGKRSINQKFIIGAVKAFPGRRFEELFYLVPKPLSAAENHQPTGTQQETKGGGTTTLPR